MINSDRIIESAHNEGFRQLVRLIESSRERRRTQRTVIEGIHLIQAYWSASGKGAGISDARLPMHALYVQTPTSHPEVQAMLARINQDLQHDPERHRPPIIGLPTALFRRVSQVENGYGPLAIIDTPRPRLPDRLIGDSLYVDRVQDPGNVGSILRTAAAAGIEQVLLAPSAAFCWAPKVLRAAMGAHFVLGIHEGVAWSALDPSRAGELTLRALAAPGQEASGGPGSGAPGHNGHGTGDLQQTDLRSPSLWICGHEGQGLSPEILADARVQRLTLAQQPGVESLNVAAAVAVALFEQRRQRRDARPRATPVSA